MAQSTSRPNILFIMADDHTCGAASCYGSVLNRTPNIDRLAREGVRFNRCFDVNSVCAPSRASILTGKHSCANGFHRNNDTFNGSQPTFPKLLQAADYQTAIVGKWHLRSRPTGFDYFDVLPGHGRYWDSPFKESGTEWQDGSQGGVERAGYVTDVITDRAVNWLENGRDRSSPFCLMVHHKAPHTPHEYPDRYSDRYTEDLPLPPTIDDDYAGRPALAACRSRDSRLDMVDADYCSRFGFTETDGPEKLSGSELRRWVYQRFYKGYLRLVAGLDDAIGRLLNYLDDSGLADNTIVVYTSDNGFFLGDHGLFNKCWMYEPSVTIPLLVRYPGVTAPGTVNDDLVVTLDYGPTFLDVAGAPVPTEMHGTSIEPLLRGESPDTWRNSFFYHYYGGIHGPQYGIEPHYGIRTARDKLIRFYDHGPGPYWEYFDLETDPSEMENRYEDRACADRIGELKAELAGMRRTYGDTEGS